MNASAASTQRRLWIYGKPWNHQHENEKRPVAPVTNPGRDFAWTGN
jgi:hypothetical protein